MLTVLGGLAEFERHLPLPGPMKAASERRRGQVRGVRFGRKLKLAPHQWQEAIARREAAEVLAEIGRSYNVSHLTISRLSSLRVDFHKLDARRRESAIDSAVVGTVVRMPDDYGSACPNAARPIHSARADVCACIGSAQNDEPTEQQHRDDYAFHS
jgi:hypothetical protein